MKAAVVTRENLATRTVRSSRQVHQHRSEIALVVASGDHYGVGTVSPQPEAIMGDPGLDQVLAAVRSRGLARLGVVGRSDLGRNWAQVHGLFGDAPEDRWTASLVESAVLDLECDESDRSWSEVLGGGETRFQAVASLLDDNLNTNDVASRYRVKVAVGVSLDFSALGVLDRPVLLDFNGDSLGIEEMLSVVRTASQYAEIVGIEQAWAIGDFTTPAAFRTAGLRLSHDESIRSVGDLRHAIRYESIDIAAIKPARCGGFAMTREIARRAQANGVDFYIGGFFEGPLGRYRNHALASSLQAGPSDVLHTETGAPVTAAESEDDRTYWIDRARRQGEWIEVGG